MGFKFLRVAKNKIELEINNMPKSLELLQIFEFNSDRKRMSIIIKDGFQYKLYVKGADNVIKARLHHNVEQPYLNKIEEKLDIFSKMGLRTLLIAWKELSYEEYSNFSLKVKAIAEVKDRDQEMGKEIILFDRFK